MLGLPAVPPARQRLLVAGVIIVGVNAGMVWSMANHVRWGWHLLGASLIFVALAWWVRRDARSAPVALVVGLSAAAQLTALLAFPLTSDDAYRYVWDGRVQLSGVNPYLHPPLSSALEHLRDDLLFPPGERPMINRPSVPTIYPPLAQVWFVLVGAVTPIAWGTVGVQVGAGAAAVATSGLLARFLGARSGWALLYGANPLVVVEAANGAHLDALCALLVFGLGWAAHHRRHWLAGLFLGLAAGVKLVPLLLLPVFLRRGRWRTSLVAVLLPAASYVPHLLVAGSLVLGFLPGYLSEEGYGGARRFALLGWLPEPWRAPVALTVAATLAVVAVVRSAKEPVLLTCCWLYGCAFLVATPSYPWYGLPFVVLVLMARRLEWLAVWVATYVAFIVDDRTGVQAAAYGAAAVVVLVVTTMRARHRPAATSSDLSQSSTQEAADVRGPVHGVRRA